MEDGVQGVARVERDERVAVELRGVPAQLDHPADAPEDPALHGEQLVAALVVLDGPRRAVHPPGVAGVVRVLVPGGVVELADLVA